MKRVSYFLLLLFLPIGILQAEQATSVTYSAHEQAGQEYNKPVHYFGLGVRLGYSQFGQSYNKQAQLGGQDWMTGKLGVPGGADAGLELRYKLERNLLRFTAGIDAVYSGSSIGGNLNYAYPVLLPSTDLTYYYDFSKVSEQHNTFEVGIPIMVGANYQGFYAQAGVRVGLPLMKTYSLKTDLTTIIHDERGIDDYTDMPNHFLDRTNPTAKGKLGLGVVNPQVAIEVGYNLDPYMQRQYTWKAGTEPSFVELIHYEVAAYANIGVLNYNDAPTQTEFYTRKAADDPEITSLMSLTDDKTLLAKDDAGKFNSMIPWNIGVRFNVYYERYDKPIEQKPRKKRKRRPKPKPEVVVEEEVVPVDTIVYNGDTIQQGDTIVMENLYFDTDKSTIRKISDPTINELAELLQSHPNLKITLVGHTDNVGRPEYNQRLSEARVVSVKNELVKRGIDGERIKTIGKGMTEPIADNRTAEGRAQNRRVEIVIDEQ